MSQGNTADKGGVFDCREDAEGIELTISKIGAPSIAVSTPAGTVNWDTGKLSPEGKISVHQYTDGGFVTTYGFTDVEDVDATIDALKKLRKLYFEDL